MKRAGLVLALFAAGPALAQDGSSRADRANRAGAYANPSAVIAAELAFAKMAQDKGQWTAFAEFAAPDAVMFVPQMVYVRTWLKGRANPPAAVQWQPHQLWSSCDGSLAVSSGAWQRGAVNGYFTTIWQRQKDGAYKWVLDHGDTLQEPLAAPEMISALVADCPRRSRGGARPGRATEPARAGSSRGGKLPPLDPARRSGRSDDGTLTWDVTVDRSGARNLSVEWRKDGSVQPATIEEVAAPANAAR